MILQKALSRGSSGNWEIDMNVIKQLGAQFDEGCDSEECFMAKFILAAYDTGFDAGVEETETAHRNMAMLMMFTEGHA